MGIHLQELWWILVRVGDNIHPSFITLLWTQLCKIKTVHCSKAILQATWCPMFRIYNSLDTYTSLQHRYFAYKMFW